MKKADIDGELPLGDLQIIRPERSSSFISFVQHRLRVDIFCSHGHD